MVNPEVSADIGDISREGAHTKLSALEHKIAVVDIGSNSVRLVVYGDGPALTPMFNEKILCGIGRDLGRSGRLHPEGVAQALGAIKRFRCLVDVMGVERLTAVATAAVRDADDGAEFLASVERDAGMKVRLLSGEEEARYAAEGVAYAIPGAKGLVGDLGGGSLELIGLSGNSVGESVTLPLGPLRLADEGFENANAQRRFIKDILSRVAWLPKYGGDAIYVVGGAWRSLCRVHMAQTDYPLRTLHHYSVSAKALGKLARSIVQLRGDDLAELAVVPRRRANLPAATMVLDELVKLVRPVNIVVSSYGLREGLMREHMDPGLKHGDPLIDACRILGHDFALYPGHGETLFDWAAPLFAGAGDERLRLAACYLSDMGWRTHANYRAEQTLLSVLSAPFVAIDQEERVVLALALFARYGGIAGQAATAPSKLISAKRAAWAAKVGLSLRLAHTLCGGNPALLQGTGLQVDDGVLSIRLAADKKALSGEMVERRLQGLAEAFGYSTAVE